jgi:ATP-dependent Zn protease/intein/homing endonuclease
MSEKKFNWSLIILSLLLLFFIIYYGSLGQKERQSITLSKVLELAKNNEIDEITIISQTEFEVKSKGKVFYSSKDPGLSLWNFLKENNVPTETLQKIKFSEKKDTWQNVLLAILVNILPLALIVILFWRVFRQAQKGATQIFSFGKSGIKVYNPNDPNRVTFKDVADLEEAKEELMEVVEFLKNPDKFLKIGAKIPKGILLVGPPGSGKTMLARSVAAEAGVPFFYISGSEFVEMLVGVGASRVRDAFAVAKRNQPCLTGDTKIIFADGSEITIKDIFENKILGKEVLSFNEKTFEIEKAKIIGVIKRPPKTIYELKTTIGTIKATGNHLFPVLKDGKLEWIPLKKLKTGNFIASILKIPTKNYIPKILELLPLQTRIYLKNHKKAVKLKDWHEEFGFESIEKIALGRGGWTDSVLNKIPEFVDEELMYFKGLIDSDGSYHKNNYSLTFVNTEKTLHEIVKEILISKFDYKPKTYLMPKNFENILPQGKKPKNLKDCFVTHINNKLIKIILRKLDDYILMMPENLIASWLSGLFDGDGYVVNINNDPKCVITASNEDLNYKIRASLLRIGVIGYLTKSNDYSSIEITGKTNLETFIRKIKSFHPKKKERIEKIQLAGKRDWRLAKIPVGELLKSARISVGMGQRSFINGHMVSCWERSKFISSRDNLINKYQEIDRWIKINNLQKTEEIEKLERLIFSDILWIKVKSIKRLPYKENVYDLCLDKNYNFLANNFFVHNCILFIDEIDAIGKMRGVGITGGHEEREQTLNQILVEMDGFEKGTRVVVLAATNMNPSLLDPALLRPGRFDRKIVLDLPDVKAREEILKIHLRDKKVGKINLKQIAQRTMGFSGADLANLCNEAAILAARRNKNEISQKELLDAIDKVLLGPEKKTKVYSKKEKEIAAYHEAGHAIVAHYLPHTAPVQKVSIIQRGRAGGYTLKTPTEDRSFYFKKEFLDELASMLGGYAAEKLVFNDITTGASNDLEIATDLAKKIVLNFGMSERLGPISFSKSPREFILEKEYSEKTAEIIDEEIKRLIDEALERATKVLEIKRDKLDKVADVLMKKEVIEKRLFEKLVGEKKGSLNI